MTSAVSVIIPTFNGARRLPALFEALAVQRAPEGGFEVIVADNNSTDDTARVAQEDPSVEALRKRGIEVRLVFERCQGAAFARVRGAMEARAPLLCFLDDDNLPAQFDYLTVGVAALRDPGVGVLISRTEPMWERKPSPSVERRGAFFALNGDPANLGYLGETPVDFGAGPSIAPTNGAGMWARRADFLAVMLDKSGVPLTGRLTNGIGAGEDIEVGILIGKAGLQRLYVPELRITHVIPGKRFTILPMCRLLVGNMRSHFTLEARHGLRGYGLRRRLLGASRLAFAVLVAPAVVLLRKDGVREAILITAQRWAEVRGPWPAFARSISLARRDRAQEPPTGVAQGAAKGE